MSQTSRRWVAWFAVFAIAAGATAGVVLQSGGSAEGRQPPVSQTHCPSGPGFVAFNAGRSVANLPLTGTSRDCSLAAASDTGGGADGSSSRAAGPRPALAVVTSTYGDCHASDEAGCADPLEIQNWPECARNLSQYLAVDHTVPSIPIPTTRPSTRRAAQAHHAGWSTYVVPSASRIPAISLGGQQIEIYTGATTVVVFADDPAVAHAAVRAMAPALKRSAASLTNPELVRRSQGVGNRC